jgi:hypothetical protein
MFGSQPHSAKPNFDIRNSLYMLINKLHFNLLIYLLGASSTWIPNQFTLVWCRNLMAKQDMSELGFSNADVVVTPPEKDSKLECQASDPKQKK